MLTLLTCFPVWFARRLVCACVSALPLLPLWSSAATRSQYAHVGLSVLKVQCGSLVADKSEQVEDTADTLDGGYLVSELQKGKQCRPTMVQEVGYVVEVMGPDTQKRAPVESETASEGLAPRSRVGEAVCAGGEYHATGSPLVDFVPGTQKRAPVESEPASDGLAPRSWVGEAVCAGGDYHTTGSPRVDFVVDSGESLGDPSRHNAVGSSSERATGAGVVDPELELTGSEEKQLDLPPVESPAEMVQSSGLSNLVSQSMAPLSPVKIAKGDVSVGSESEPNGFDDRQLGPMVAESAVIKLVQSSGAKGKSTHQLDEEGGGSRALGADQRGAAGQEIGEDAPNTDSNGVWKPEVDTGELRQSERLKKQNSGDEDMMQKAKRRAQIRNLELDPSYLIEWILAECMGRTAEKKPEGDYDGGKPKAGVCGKANPQFSWVAA